VRDEGPPASPSRRASRIAFEEEDVPEGDEWRELHKIEVDALDLLNEVDDPLSVIDDEEKSLAMTREITDVTCYEDSEFNNYLTVQLLLDYGSNVNTISTALFQ
jgi:hypothetical protein